MKHVKAFVNVIKIAEKPHRLAALGAFLVLFLTVPLSFLIVFSILGNKVTQSKAVDVTTVSETVSWPAVQFRHQVCLAGTSQCQPFQYTSSTSVFWTLASLIKYDLHVDVTDGVNWYGWETQNNVGIDCFGPSTCSKGFSWASVDYIVTTTIDNIGHKVTGPATSYVYTFQAQSSFAYTGTVTFHDFDNFGSVHTNKILSGTITVPLAVAAPACTYTPDTVAVGGTITVTSLNGLTGEVRVVGAFWPQPATGSVLIGTLAANAPTASLAVSGTSSGASPLPITAGGYAVRVGGFGVLCTTTGGGTSLSVTAAAPATFVPNYATCLASDVNRDGRINSTDLLIVAKNTTPQTAYNSAYDVNHDGKVNSTDLLIVSKYQGKICASIGG